MAVVQRDRQAFMMVPLALDRHMVSRLESASTDLEIV
jgi:hypothetical protein